jgi:MoaA/NifB/PqqE/SkfB family radical SAM enzyme
MFTTRSRREDFGWIVALPDGTIDVYDRDVRGLPAGEVEAYRVAVPADLDRLSGPITAGIELTLACNLTCQHCYISAGTARDGELPTRRVLENAQLLADAGVLFAFLTGGEVTLRPDFPELVTGVAETGLDYNVISNGSGLSTSVLSRIPPQTTFVISVDGLAAHRLLRGRQTFEQVTARILALRESGFPVIGSTVVNRANLAELPELYAWAERHRVIVTVLDVQTVGRAKENAAVLRLRRDDLDAYRRFLTAKLRYERLLPELYDESFGGAREYSNPNYYGFEETLMTATGLNYQGNFYVYVAADGVVYPDNFYAGERLYPGGVLGQDDFADIWARIRQATAASNYDAFDCRGCPVHESGLFCDFKSAALSLYLHGAPNVCGADDVEKEIMLMRARVRDDEDAVGAATARRYDNF